MIAREFIQKFFTRLSKVDKEQIDHFMKSVMADLDLLYLFLDNAYEGVIIFNSKREIELANRKAIEILRKDKTENLTGKNIEEVIPSVEFKKYLEEKIKNQTDIIDEEHIMGSPLVRVLRIHFFPLKEEDKIRFYVLTFYDITRKKLEEIKNKRKENIASMTSLAAGLAHEIKNPLASIDIHLELLARYLKNAPDFKEKTEMKQFLGVLKEEVARLNSIVQDFLSTLRPISLDLRKVNIIDILKDLAIFLSLELESKNIRLTLDIEDNLPFVLADHKYLRIVFLNLLKNAMEAFPEEKENKQIRIKVYENYPFVEVVIEDNARGIPRENLDKIFEPYFTTKSFGTGLGLTIVHKIITEHNGNIRIESEEGKGTAFTVLLPQYKGETQKFLESGKK